MIHNVLTRNEKAGKSEVKKVLRMTIVSVSAVAKLEWRQGKRQVAVYNFEV